MKKKNIYLVLYSPSSERNSHALEMKQMLCCRSTKPACDETEVIMLSLFHRLLLLLLLLLFYFFLRHGLQLQKEGVRK